MNDGASSTRAGRGLSVSTPGPGPAAQRPRTVALVTDSTSGLSDGEAAGVGLTVVPLHVLLDSHDLAEGVDVTAAEVGTRLPKTKKAGTSRPSPRAFLTAYEQLAGSGVTEIVSVHLSAKLSGTHDAALLAARDAPVPVHVLDSGLAGAGLAYAVHAAGRAITEAVDDAPHDTPVDVAAAAREAVHRSALDTVTLFYVHTLEWLRKGGRIGAASAFLGGALAVKPLLELTDGHIEPVEKLRTQGRALARLQEVVAERARRATRPLALVVHHVDAVAKAEKVAAHLAETLHGSDPASTNDAGQQSTPRVAAPRLVPVPAALAVHVGPGAIGVMLCPVADQDTEREVAVRLGHGR